jgi:aminotransferase in exopolysaccharide biosynthesis
VPLHEPRFIGNEKEYLINCIDSTFVSSVGKYVDQFELQIQELTRSKYAIAVVNGTNALHISLLLSNVCQGDEVLTQSVSFIATANAISYSYAKPIFIDVDRDTLGMSPKALGAFLNENAELKGEYCYNRTTGKRIRACVPMHTFGISCKIDEIAAICKQWKIALIEDSAESMGSYYRGKHTGTFGDFGIFSFNGNKTITSGGGGVIITDNEVLAKKAKYLTTQAKVPHKWEFKHDMIGYNYRMPNLNAALACAQLEQLAKFVENKRELAAYYNESFSTLDVEFVKEPAECISNYWLNAIIFKDIEERNKFLEFSNSKGVMTRPIWNLISSLPMFESCQSDDLVVSKWLVDRVVNIPSSVRLT